MHEASLHEENSFITLTFDEQNLPDDGSINPEHLQSFFKRLRERIYPKRFSYFACGEYGEQLGRPHYHAIIFGHGFPDKEPISKNRENLLYTSAALAETWVHGLHSIGEVTQQSASYVARYSMKKIGGDNQEEHYQGKRPEFLLTSKRPAIGKRWFEKHRQDCLKGYLTLKGKKYPVPKYYEKLWAEADDFTYSTYKANRAQAIDDCDIEQTPGRLRVKETIRKKRIQTITNRSLNDAL